MSITGQAAIEISTDQGGRQYQQDRATFSRHGGHITACVADGMGSGQGSDKIAHMAATFAVQIASVYGPEQPGAAVAAAAECVRAAAEDERGENDNTTLVLVTVEPCGDSSAHVRVGWVGDSRAYVYTKRGKLIPLTKDHNQAPHFPNVLTRTLLGPELYHLHDDAGECLSHRPEFAEYSSLNDPAALVVLMTDGVCGVLPDNEISDILIAAPNARRAAKRLTGRAVREARAKGGSPDNATALVIDLDPRTEA